MSGMRILVADDDADMLAMLARHLEREGFAVTTVRGAAAGLPAMLTGEWDIALTGRPDARVLLMTAFGSLETAIEAMRQGACDGRLRREHERLRARVEAEHGIGRILGASMAMEAVLAQIRAGAAGDAPVLLLGESGTGKALAARALHLAGPRRTEPFVPVSCGAIPESRLEAELFGDRRQSGRFLTAHRGTLFLDEIGDLPLALQGTLLRVVEGRAVHPVGGTGPVPLDVRLVSATHRDVAEMIRDGQLREDLYLRLAGLPIRLPALRERPDDIPLLAHHVLDAAAGRLGKVLTGFDEPALEWMAGHRWPGNVRELESVVERAAVLAKGPLVTLGDLGTELSPAGGLPSLRPTLDELERQYIRRVLDESRGDKPAAARVLGVSVRTLQRRVKTL